MMKKYRNLLLLVFAAGMTVLTLPMQAQKQVKEFSKWAAGSFAAGNRQTSSGAAYRDSTLELRAVGDRLYWIGGAGDAWAPAYYELGIRTFTSSIATVAPKLSMRLHELASAGDSTALTEFMNEYVNPLYAIRARRKGYEVSAMKEMMNLIGLAAGPVRPPLPNVRAEETAELKNILAKWKPFLS